MLNDLIFSFHSMQSGDYALGLVQPSKYAVFGPYTDMCITAPHSCQEGFTIGLWIHRGNLCDNSASTMFSTRSLAGGTGAKEGLEIRCDTGAPSDNDFNIHLKVCT